MAILIDCWPVKLIWVLGKTMARYCITAFSKDCSLAFPFPLRSKALKSREVIPANNPLHGFEY